MILKKIHGVGHFENGGYMLKIFKYAIQTAFNVLLYTKFQSSSYFIVFIMNFRNFRSVAILKMDGHLEIF